MKKDFKTELEKLISKHGDSVLANYISKCISEFDEKKKLTENTPKAHIQEPVRKQEPIPANIGNNVTTGWSNPFGGTSWGV